MFRTLQYYYWNMGYIFYDYWDDFKRNYLSSNNYGYPDYRFYDDNLVEELNRLEDRIYELETEPNRTDIVLVLKDQKEARLKKLLRSQSY
jgi:hypothetical protein